MGYPVNSDGSFDYDHPLPTPQRLTDPQAGYEVAPSAAAKEAAQDFMSWLHSRWEELSNDECSHEVAARFDAFAAKAVAAREAEIVAALERYLSGCYKSQETARQIGYLESAARYDPEIAAYETSIAVVKREL